MKKILVALAVAVTSLGAMAHVSSRVHYHNDNGTISYSRSFEPRVENTYERDNRGRRVRVETTTRCVSTRINPRNNHLRCVDWDTTVRRFPGMGPGNRPTIDPVITRVIERDDQGRRVIVTTTRTCVDPRWTANRTAFCNRWETTVTREVVRRQPRSGSFDLNGDGRTDPWERLLFQGFRNILDND